MRPTLSHCILTFFIAAFFSCSQDMGDEVDYSTLNYDSSTIKIFKWEAKSYVIPENSEPLPLEQEDLKNIYDILDSCVKDYNKRNTLYPGISTESKYAHINLNEYKKQLFPYKDYNGQKFVFVNCFCRDDPDWRNFIVAVKDGGKCYFSALLNLSEKVCTDFDVNDAP